jgi:hypothetical protein
MEMLVRLPPGRAMLEMKLSLTGSLPITKTIGIADVPFSAARAAGGPPAATKSCYQIAMIAGSRSYRPATGWCGLP